MAPVPLPQLSGHVFHDSVTGIEVFLFGNFRNRGNGPPLVENKELSEAECWKPYGSEGLSRRPNGYHSPWALMRVCRLVHNEVSPLLAAVDLKNGCFYFWAFTYVDWQAWLDRMGDERKSHMRNWSMEGRGHCHGGFYDRGEAQLDRDAEQEQGPKPDDIDEWE